MKKNMSLELLVQSVTCGLVDTLITDSTSNYRELYNTIYLIFIYTCIYIYSLLIGSCLSMTCSFTLTVSTVINGKYTAAKKIQLNVKAKTRTWTMGFLENSLLDLLSCTSNLWSPKKIKLNCSSSWQPKIRYVEKTCRMMQNVSQKAQILSTTKMWLIVVLSLT